MPPPATLPADIACAVEASAEFATRETIAACSGGAWSGNSTSIPRRTHRVTYTENVTAARWYLRLKVLPGQ